jgi:hypothetical protein
MSIFSMLLKRSGDWLAAGSHVSGGFEVELIHFVVGEDGTVVVGKAVVPEDVLLYVCLGTAWLGTKLQTDLA